MLCMTQIIVTLSTLCPHNYVHTHMHAYYVFIEVSAWLKSSSWLYPLGLKLNIRSREIELFYF